MVSSLDKTATVAQFDKIPIWNGQLKLWEMIVDASDFWSSSSLYIYGEVTDPFSLYTDAFSSAFEVKVECGNEVISSQVSILK